MQDQKPFHANQENLKYFRVRKDFFLGERDREHWHKKSQDDSEALEGENRSLDNSCMCSVWTSPGVLTKDGKRGAENNRESQRDRCFDFAFVGFPGADCAWPSDRPRLF